VPGAEGVPPALSDALAAVGDRWTLLIVTSLLGGAQRFGDLERSIEGIAPNVLSSRLRDMTEQGLVVAEPYSERPQRFAYGLTDGGRALAAPLRLLTQWGASRGEGTGPVHDACGAELEAVWYCPACERPVSDAEADELHYA
jgi:DNA-binding HxlR family transcriptional regulator